MSTENSLLLKGGDSFITLDPTAAYKVDSGTALVYIVRMTDGEAGRRYLVLETGKGSVIPSLSFTDELSRSWCFCIACVDHADLTLIENGATKALKMRFAKAAGIQHYEYEGFENSFSDLYEKNLAEEDALLIKNIRLANEIKQNNEELVFNPLNDDKETRHDPPDDSGLLLYRAVEFYCRRCGIEIAYYEKLLSLFGKEFTLSDIARASHFSYTKVRTEKKWFRKDCGTIMVFRKDGTAAVCIPRDDSSYDVFLPESGKIERLTREFAESVSNIAVTICRPFPSKSLGKNDIILFCARSVTATDVIMTALMSLAGMFSGILLPLLVRSIYDDFLPLHNAEYALSLCAAVIVFLKAEGLFGVVNKLSVFRLKNKITHDCQNAAFDRIFKLPETFFDRYDSVDLASRTSQTGEIIGGLCADVVLLITNAFACAVYLVCSFYYSAELGILGFLTVLLCALLKLLISNKTMSYDSESTKAKTSAASNLYHIVSGIDKIRIAGAEDRALAQYLKPLKRHMELKQKRTATEILSSVIETSAKWFSAAVIFLAASNNGCSIGTLIGFLTAFSFFSAAAFKLTNRLSEIKQLQAAYSEIKPLLDEIPELNVEKNMPLEISGAVEINNITFSYPDNPAVILKNISLDIKAGAYIGIVGASGSGKSTLMKLMLGFLKPNTGKIYYDGKDIDDLDKHELRKKFGVVMQESGLISGSISDNICVTAPSAMRDEILAVSKLTGLHEYVSRLPMGYNTVLNESSSTIAGGQLQRILIARSLISKPKILFFDEATSALDNSSQDKIHSVLESTDATKIVIAHRLSTIKKCDEIIVLDKGEIAERGSFDELIKKRGLFYTFAKQQTDF